MDVGMTQTTENAESCEASLPSGRPKDPSPGPRQLHGPATTLGPDGLCWMPFASMGRVVFVISIASPDCSGPGITRKGQHRDILDERAAFCKLIRTRAAAQGQSAFNTGHGFDYILCCYTCTEGNCTLGLKPVACE